MAEDEVRQCAFAMPLTSPAYPKGPYRFVDREYLILTGTMGYKHGRMDSQSDLALDQWQKLLAILRRNSARSRSFA